MSLRDGRAPALVHPLDFMLFSMSRESGFPCFPWLRPYGICAPPDIPSRLNSWPARFGLFILYHLRPNLLSGLSIILHLSREGACPHAPRFRRLWTAALPVEIRHIFGSSKNFVETASIELHQSRFMFGTRICSPLTRFTSSRAPLGVSKSVCLLSLFVCFH